MNTKIEKSGNKMNIVVEGRLDTNTAPVFMEEVGTIPEGVDDIVLDFTDLDYIASSGLRAILSILKMAQKNGGAVTIKNPNDMISEVLETTGFDELVNIDK